VQQHFENETKKHGATVLLVDVSYAGAKHLCKYQGEPVFKGLITGLNEKEAARSKKCFVMFWTQNGRTGALRSSMPSVIIHPETKKCSLIFSHL
jgi:hypothetical protein